MGPYFSSLVTSITTWCDGHGYSFLLATQKIEESSRALRMVVSAATLLSYALVSREVISMTTSLPNAVRVQLRSSITRNVTTAMLSFSFISILQTTSSVATLDTCSQPGGKKNTLETTLLIRDARESTGMSLYWAKGMKKTRLHGSVCALPDSVAFAKEWTQLGCVQLTLDLGVWGCRTLCVFSRGGGHQSCMLRFSKVRLLDTLLEQ